MYQPVYQPRYYPRYYSRHYPQHYPRYYPSYRPAVRARTYYTQQVAPEAVSPSTTPAAPLLETVEDEKAAGQTYSAGPTDDAGPAALGSHEPESESEGDGSESGVTVESVTEAGSYEPRVEIESTTGSYESGVGDDSVTEAVYGVRISDPELDGPAVRTTAGYGERITVAEDGARYRQETTAAAVTETETAVETVTETETVGPIYRQDIP